MTEKKKTTKKAKSYLVLRTLCDSNNKMHFAGEEISLSAADAKHFLKHNVVKEL